MNSSAASPCVALQIGERALELALEAAPVEDVEQRVDVGARFEFGDRALRLGDFGLEPFDLRQQQGRRPHRRIIACRLVGLVRGHVPRHSAPVRAQSY